MDSVIHPLNNWGQVVVGGESNFKYIQISKIIGESPYYGSVRITEVKVT